MARSGLCYFSCTSLLIFELQAFPSFKMGDNVNSERLQPQKELRQSEMEIKTYSWGTRWCLERIRGQGERRKQDGEKNRRKECEVKPWRTCSSCGHTWQTCVLSHMNNLSSWQFTVKTRFGLLDSDKTGLVSVQSEKKISSCSQTYQKHTVHRVKECFGLEQLWVNMQSKGTSMKERRA